MFFLRTVFSFCKMSHSFEAVDGLYQMFYSNYAYKDSVQSSFPTRLSFLENVCIKNNRPDLTNGGIDSSENESDTNNDFIYCYNIGKELRFCLGAQSVPFERKLFHFTPSCHTFKPRTKNSEAPKLLIGFSNGDIEIIYPLGSEPPKSFNIDVGFTFHINIATEINRSECSNKCLLGPSFVKSVLSQPLQWQYISIR